MSGVCNGEQSDLFAVVSYLPEPLADFINRVRQELAPDCRLLAHITLLPPRPLACPLPIMRHEIEKGLAQFHTFRIALGEVAVFPVSDVIYLSIGTGRQQIRELHERLNHGRCLSREQWNFEPHVTLAQELAAAAVPQARETAVRRWKEYSGPREFTLDTVTLVEGSTDGGWTDLAVWELPAPVLVA